MDQRNPCLPIAVGRVVCKHREIKYSKVCFSPGVERTKNWGQEFVNVTHVAGFELPRRFLDDVFLPEAKQVEISKKVGTWRWAHASIVNNFQLNFRRRLRKIAKKTIYTSQKKIIIWVWGFSRNIFCVEKEIKQTKTSGKSSIFPFVSKHFFPSFNWERH